MKIRKYTRKKKVWALFLFILFISITLAGGLGLYYVNNFGNFLYSKTELLKNGRFEDTETLERKILDDTEAIFQYVVLARLFGDEDELNRTAPLYVVSINGTQYNLCLEDLDRINRVLEGNGASATESVKIRSYSVGEEGSETTDGYQNLEENTWSGAERSDYLNQFAELYGTTYETDPGDWFDISDEGKEAIIKENNWEDKYKQSTWPVRVELVSSAEILIYEGQRCELVHDYMQQKEVNETVDLQSLYDRGEQLLGNYYDLKNRLDGEETNLRYIVYETSSGLMETNDSSMREETIRGLEKYISYDNSTHRIRSNFTKTDIKYWNLDDMASTLVGVDSGASFTVGLDTRYLVQDEYKQISDGFRQCRPILMASLPAIVIGMLGSILAFIYLLASVGHREDYDEIWLDKFDRWATEPAAVTILGGILVFIVLCAFLADFFAKNFFTSSLIYTVMQVISVIVSAIIALIGFFSLVKRLKAGVLWKNSLLRKLFVKLGSWIMAMVRNWPTSGKAAAVIFVYWVVTIPLCMFITINRFWGSLFLYMLGIIVFVGVQLTAAGIILWAVIKRKKILEGVEMISAGDLEYVIDDDGMFADDKKLVNCINHIGAGLQDAVSTAVQSERMKADLITNVSHDIKTPLTSIINYVDLMKRENIENETVKRYLEVLEQKSQRLKNLTEDLVEASRASSGNISLQMERINFVELVKQACGEFSEKFEERELIPVVMLPEHSVHVIADGRRLWRILENLFQNTKKYAMPHTRVYVSVEEQDGFACFTIKNISESPLNITAEELTERFTRGDASRTTEGSGLGLSIAKSLTEVQGGIFEIYLNGDLFQATVQFEISEEEPEEEVLAEEDGEEDQLPAAGDECGADGEAAGGARSEVKAGKLRLKRKIRGRSQKQAENLPEEETEENEQIKDTPSQETGTAEIPEEMIGKSSEAEKEAEEALVKEALEELRKSGLLKEEEFTRH
ncbi:sensor histidine kinase [Qiania dongpingensis]|nr:histidine kinase dimerization/phospho-acceptor domain-containing protein [Qiania dongpingensis]